MPIDVLQAEEQTADTEPLLMSGVAGDEIFEGVVVADDSETIARPVSVDVVTATGIRLGETRLDASMVMSNESVVGHFVPATRDGSVTTVIAQPKDAIDESPDTVMTEAGDRLAEIMVEDRLGPESRNTPRYLKLLKKAQAWLASGLSIVVDKTEEAVASNAQDAEFSEAAEMA